MRWRILAVAAGALLALAPAARAADELEVAYDYYQTGQGFQIGLRSQDGTALPLPAGVNTAADELHPALSPDGRFLVFTRMTLQPKLNGDIPVPAQRSLVWVDLTTGEMPFSTFGAGPTFTPRGSGSDLAWGVAPDGTSAGEGNTLAGKVAGGSHAPSFGFPMYTTLSSAANAFFPHVATVRNAFTEPLVNSQACNGQCLAGRDLRYTTIAAIDSSSGATTSLKTRLAVVGLQSGGGTEPVTLQSVDVSGANHAAARAGDHYVAMDRSGDIATMDFPGDASATTAPAPFSTSDAEQMPAWAPDGLRLGWVRVSGGHRNLELYDLTPGIQSILATLDLGAVAPTPQTQGFQSVWGSIALAKLAVAPAIVCTVCSPAAIRGPLVNLSPTISLSPIGQQVGIFVVRRKGGKHTVLGVKEPRIKAIGRVPLGATRRGRNHLEWDGRVNGRRLRPGRYLLTFRLLRHGAVTATSKSIPFRVRG
jgi:hypothetical protein